MTTTDVGLTTRLLDAAYRAFPTFEEWSNQTNVDSVVREAIFRQLNPFAHPNDRMMGFLALMGTGETGMRFSHR